MPATGSLGTLTGKLSMESAAFIRDMGKAAASVSSNTAKMSRGFTAIEGVAKKAFAGYIGIKGVEALVNLGQQAIQTGDEIGAAATKLGIGAEALQKFRFAAAQTDVDTGSLDAALKVFSKNLAAGKIAASTGDITGAFQEWINKIREAPSQLEKVSLATQAFGKQFQSALLIAAQGDTFLSSLKDAYVISQRGIDIASQLDNKIRAIENAVQAGFQTGFLEAFVGKLGDSETKLDDVNKAMKELGGIIGTIAAASANLLDRTLSRVQTFLQAHPEFTKLALSPTLGIEQHVPTTRGGGRFANYASPMAPPPKEVLPPQLTRPDDAVKAINETTDAFNAGKEAIGAWSTEVTDALGRTLTNMEQINSEGSNLFASLQTPMESYASSIERISFLQSKGAIDAETFARAHQQLTLGMAANWLGAAAAVSGALAGIFKDNKAFAIANAVINTAEAIVSALKNPPGPPFSFVYAAAAAATGAAQIATILSAQPGSARIPSVKGKGKTISSKAISAGEGTTAATSAATAVPSALETAKPPPGQAVNITLVGTGGFDREQVRSLINHINEAVGDGAQLRVSG